MEALAEKFEGKTISELIEYLREHEDVVRKQHIHFTTKTRKPELMDFCMEVEAILTQREDELPPVVLPILKNKPQTEKVEEPTEAETWYKFDPEKCTAVVLGWVKRETKTRKVFVKEIFRQGTEWYARVQGNRPQTTWGHAGGQRKYNAREHVIHLSKFTFLGSYEDKTLPSWKAA